MTSETKACVARWISRYVHKARRWWLSGFRSLN